jgi:hypothetical protein
VSKLLIVTLFVGLCGSCSMAQTVSGPYSINHTVIDMYGDLILQSSGNDGVNLFYGYTLPDTNRDVALLRYSLSGKDVDKPPQLIFNDQGWRGSILQSVEDGHGRWTSVIRADASGNDNCNFRVFVVTGTDSTFQSGLIFEGCCDWIQRTGNCLSVRNLLLAPSGDLILVAERWEYRNSHATVYLHLEYFRHGQTSSYFTYEYEFPDTTSHYQIVGSYGTTDNRVFMTLEQDSSILSTTLPPMATNAQFDTVQCSFQYRTAGGRLLSLSNYVGNYNPYSIHIRELMPNGECRPVSDTVTAFQYNYAVFHPLYGWALFACDHNQLVLARIDTNGVFFQPSGVLYIRSDRVTIGSLTAQITDQGNIIVAWTEYFDYWLDEGLARELKVCWLDWNCALFPATAGKKIIRPTFEMSIFPNPANSSTTISLVMPQSGVAQLSIDDILGRQVNRDLTSSAPVWYNAGYHNILFNGTGLASGTYFARMKIEQQELTRKFSFIK